MIPYLLAAVGGYLIGQSQKKDVPQMAKGGKLPNINDVREDGELVDSQMIDEGYVSNAGEQEFYKYKDKTYVITTWNENAEEHKDGEEEISIWEGEMANGGVVKEIEAKKKSLIKKAKAKGIYENFGQKEVRQIEDKYGYTKEVAEFDNWAMNFDMNELKNYADGGDVDLMTNTFVNLFRSRGFKEKRGSMGLRFFEHKPTGVFITYDPKGTQTAVIITTDKSGQNTIYEGNSIRQVMESLDRLGITDYYAKGGKIPEKEVESLKRYTMKWYGKDGIADDDDADFKPPVTQKEVEDAVREYVTFCKKAISEGNESKWGGGDSFDREVVADIMQYNRNPEADTFFYPELIKEIKNIDGKMPMMYAKGGKVKSKKWIQDALGGDEGSLRRTAKRKGLLKGDENLSMTDLKKLQKMGGKTAKRAHLAETLRKFDDGGMMAKGGVNYTLDYFKMKLDELDPEGNINVQYDSDKNEWYWEDYSKDTYKTGFKREKDALDDVLGYLEENK